MAVINPDVVTCQTKLDLEQQFGQSWKHDVFQRRIRPTEAARTLGRCSDLFLENRQGVGKIWLAFAVWLLGEVDGFGIPTFENLPRIQG